MSDTAAWIVVAAMFATVYALGLATMPLIRQISDSWPPFWWSRLKGRKR